MYWMYILTCADNSYYVGHTKQLDKRLARHQTGSGAGFTKAHLPVKLVYREAFATEIEAVARERQIKGWSRVKKKHLILGELSALKTASRRYSL